MATFRAQVPPGVVPGQEFVVQAPDGRSLRLVCPPGALWQQGATVNVLSPHAVIESIRHEHMFGPQPDPRNQKMKERLSRSVERLSEDLYSSKTHCIMELVQNSDDNAYGRGKTPTLWLIVNGQHLVVANNELGFQEPNVRAICDVSKSTKEQKEGFIGEKGIGFKSVFTISDEPHVRSNGYAFKLKHKRVSGDELGFIMPYHCTDNDWPPEILHFLPPDITSFLLPFRRDFNPRELAANLTSETGRELQPVRLR